MIQSNQAIIILLYNITFVGLYKGYHIYRALQYKIYLIAEENYKKPDQKLSCYHGNSSHFFGF